MGDPAGIGPEIIIKSLTEGELSGAPLVVVGCARTLQRVLEKGITAPAELRVISRVSEARFSPAIINVLDEPLADPEALQPGVVQAQAGDLAYRCVRRATELAMAGEVKAIATAPLNKEALHLAGHHYPGHTELLAHLTDSKDYAMVLYTDQLKVIHITTHIALRKFLDTLNQDRVKTVIGIADTFLKRVGYKNPRIAVAGEPARRGERSVWRRRDQDCRSGGRGDEGEGAECIRAVPTGHGVYAVPRRDVRHGGGDVPRSGSYPVKTPGFLRRCEHHRRAAVYPYFCRPWHRIRHCVDR